MADMLASQCATACATPSLNAGVAGPSTRCTYKRVPPGRSTAATYRAQISEQTYDRNKVVSIIITHKHGKLVVMKRFRVSNIKYWRKHLLLHVTSVMQLSTVSAKRFRQEVNMVSAPALP